MIRVESISKRYDSLHSGVITALRDVSFHVSERAVHGLIGLSDAGKSTALRTINLLKRPDSGKVLIDGEDLLAKRPDELRLARQRIGMIFQHLNLLANRTVAGNVALPLEVAGWKPAEIRSRVAEMLELMQIAEKAKAYPANLSGGQKQRVAPPRYHERYRAEPPPLPANFLPLHPFNNGALVIRVEELAPWPRTPDVVRRHLGDYYAAIEFLDAQVGRILDALADTGQYENTLIVFAADHGLAIGSHGLFGKQNLYEHSMRAPLIIAGPGIAAGRRADALSYLHDVFPTLGELCGVPAPEGNEG